MSSKLSPKLICGVAMLLGMAGADELTAVIQKDLGLTESDVEACRNP